MAEVKKTAKKAPVKKATAKAVKPAAKVAAPKAAKEVAKTAVKKVAAKKAVAKKEVVAKVEAAPVVEAVAEAKAPVAEAKTSVAEVKVEIKAEKAEVKTEAKEVKVEVRPVASKDPEFNLQEMLELGCHLGHKSSKWHPKMAEYIYSEKDGIHLFDLPKVSALLEEAYSFVYNLAKEGKTIVLVGTKKQAREVIKEAALDASCFYITARWMGGMLTNWPQVSKSIKRMEEIREGLNTGKYNGYTKYERVQLEKEQINQ
jgi:hypothetical protein